MKKNNTSETKIWSIDDYLQQKKLSLASLKQKVIAGQISLLIWVDNLHCSIATPKLKIEKEGNELTFYKEPTAEFLTGYLFGPRFKLLPLLDTSIEVDFSVSPTNMIIRRRSRRNRRARPMMYRNSAYTYDFKAAFAAGLGSRMPSSIEIFGLQNTIELLIKRELTSLEISSLALLNLELLRNLDNPESPESPESLEEKHTNFKNIKNQVFDAIEKHETTDFSNDHIICDPSPSFSFHTSIDAELKSYIAKMDNISVPQSGTLKPITPIVEKALKYGYYKNGNYPTANTNQLYITENISALMTTEHSLKAILSKTATNLTEKTIEEEEPELEYEDDMIGLANETRDVFWSSYDPSNPETIPTAQDIIDWLISEKRVSSQHKASQIEAVARNGRAKPAGRPKKII